MSLSPVALNEQSGGKPPTASAAGVAALAALDAPTPEFQGSQDLPGHTPAAACALGPRLASAKGALEHEARSLTRQAGDRLFRFGAAAAGALSALFLRAGREAGHASAESQPATGTLERLSNFFARSCDGETDPHIAPASKCVRQKDPSAAPLTKCAGETDLNAAPLTKRVREKDLCAASLKKCVREVNLCAAPLTKCVREKDLCAAPPTKCDGETDLCVAPACKCAREMDLFATPFSKCVGETDLSAAPATSAPRPRPRPTAIRAFAPRPPPASSPTRRPGSSLLHRMRGGRGGGRDFRKCTLHRPRSDGVTPRRRRIRSTAGSSQSCTVFSCGRDELGFRRVARLRNASLAGPVRVARAYGDTGAHGAAPSLHGAASARSRP